MWLVLALGMVLCIEGLALALAPRRLEDVLAFLLRLPPENRRLLGLLALAAGTALLWAARRLGA